MDRVQKLRQMFNKAAGEGKPKLSVNDFSELPRDPKFRSDD